MNTAERILQKIDTTRSSTVVVNQNNSHLKLEKKHIKKIMKIGVFETYGKRRIRKEKPWIFIKIGSFWVVYGTLNKYEKGGVFELVINSRNGAIEYLIHGK
ncbi:MAG: NTF2 fold immunity protein [Bacteroidota bacterium]